MTEIFEYKGQQFPDYLKRGNMMQFIAPTAALFCEGLGLDVGGGKWPLYWSTQAVERAMIEADVSRARRAEKIDALAAAHILQGAIDALANLGSGS